MGEGLRRPLFGKTHRADPERLTHDGWDATACGIWTEPLTEVVDSDTLRDSDRCKRCFPSPSPEE